jgi:endonuclease
MAIYDKPTKILMRDFAKDELLPGQVFEKKQAVQWFSTKYPDIRPTTVQMHVEGMSVNSTLRKHHPSIKPGSGHDLFFKVGPGRYRLWEEATDGPPVYGEKSQRWSHDCFG